MLFKIKLNIVSKYHYMATIANENKYQTFYDVRRKLCTMYNHSCIRRKLFNLAITHKHITK